MQKHKNGSFTNSLGFVLACVGSAVGLGNIWMFPYRLGEYGGAAFLILYIFFICLFGFVGLSAEFAIGRKAGTGTLGAYEMCWSSRKRQKAGKILGWIPLLGSLGIAVGYSVIIGWVLRFLWDAVTNQVLEQEASEYFSGVTSFMANVPWHVAVILITVVVLLSGAAVQIEKANKILMPLFFILFAGLAVRVFFLPGAVEGYKFLFIPKWEALADVDTWVMAMGQAFFSLSITGSGMIVYGSYLSKKEDIPKASLQTAFFDTIAAMLSALAIMPAVFAFGIQPSAGPSLMFITIPNIFRQMPMGNLFLAVFFLSVSFAGITSLINMFEAVSESWQNRFGLGRKWAVILCGTIALVTGLLIEEESRVGSWMDFVTIIIVPLGAVLGAVSIYYVLGFEKIKEELETGREKPLAKFFRLTAIYIYVPLTVLVFILGLIYKGIG